MPQASPDRPTALARRRAGDALDRASEVGESSSTLAVSFEDADGRAWTSWETVPDDVRGSLVSVGCAVGRPFASGASPPQNQQRDTSAVQRATAWAVTTTRVIVVDAVRPIQPGDAARPGSGDWELDVRVRPVLGTPGRRIGTIPSDAQPTYPPRAGPDDAEPDVIDLLPAAVRRQVTTTVPTPDTERETLVQTVVGGLPQQQEAALLRASPQRAVAVVARRAIRARGKSSRKRAERALHEADWQVEVLTAELGPERLHTLRPSRPALTATTVALEASGDMPQRPRPGEGDG